MSTLKITIEHIALNDGTPIPEGPFKEQISEMEGWMTVGVAAVALDRNTNEIAARVYEYRRTGRHWASNRKLRPVGTAPCPLATWEALFGTAEQASVFVAVRGRRP